MLSITSLSWLLLLGATGASIAILWRALRGMRQRPDVQSWLTGTTAARTQPDHRDP